jgi:GNAT superfamily N-acetyltransferase
MIKADFQTAEIGYFFDPDYRRRGYAQETVRKLLELGFTELLLFAIRKTKRLFMYCKNAVCEKRGISLKKLAYGGVGETATYLPCWRKNINFFYNKLLYCNVSMKKMKKSNIYTEFSFNF